MIAPQSTAWWFYGCENLESAFAEGDAITCLTWGSNPFLGYYTEDGVQIIDASGEFTSAMTDDYRFFNAADGTVDENGKGHLYAYWKTEGSHAVLATDGTLSLIRSKAGPTGDGDAASIAGTADNTYTGMVWSLDDLTTATVLSATDVPWNDYRESIQRVVSYGDQSMAPASTAWWFSGCTNLASADLTGLNTEDAEDLTGMFDGATSLASVTLGTEFQLQGQRR